MFGAQIRTDAEVAQIRTSGARVTGVTLASGEAIDAPVVVTTAHPQISFLRLLDPAELPRSSSPTSAAGAAAAAP